MTHLMNIRGTSGSGKTTAVRELMSKSVLERDVYVEGRKQPLYSVFMYPVYAERPDGTQYYPRFAVLGHYNSPCGGCDTLKRLDDVFELYQKIKEEFDYVIAEGKILGDDTKRSVLLGDEMTIFYLTTSIADCYEGVRQRRIARGQLEKAEEKPKKLEKDAKTIASATRRLSSKIKVINVTRETIVEEILKEGLRSIATRV